MPVYNCPLICMLVRFGRVLPGVATQPLCTSTLWEDTWPWTSVASEGHFPQRVSWVVRPKVPIWGSPQRATYCIGSTMKCMEALYQHKQMQLYSYMHHYASPFEYTTTIYKVFQMILHDLTLQVQAICCSQKKRGPYQPSSCRGRVGDGPWDPKKVATAGILQHVHIPNFFHIGPDIVKRHGRFQVFILCEWFWSYVSAFWLRDISLKEAAFVSLMAVFRQVWHELRKTSRTCRMAWWDVFEFGSD